MNYCTYFDKNYLSRGLALYDSLLKNHKAKFHLYIVAFDQFTYDFLKKKNFKFISCVYFEDFENQNLKKVKKDRTLVEYLWTCTSSIIFFFIQKYKLSSCTYLDADIYFFSDPKIIYKNQSNYSVLITSHNYHPKYDQSKTSGKYCVQYLTFKNNREGIQVLNYWKKQCIKWCYNRVEGNKFGDQKYLDSWPGKFSGVEVTTHLGAGVAPWNVKRFQIKINKKKFILENNNRYQLIFYHFHDLKFFFNNNFAFLSSYDLSQEVINKIYKPYIKNIISIEKKHKLNFDANQSKVGSNFLNKLFFYIKLIIKFVIYYKNFKII
jgi:hypothetical protein